MTESIYYYISAQIQDLHVIDWGGGELSAKRSPMPDRTMSGERENTCGRIASQEEQEGRSHGKGMKTRSVSFKWS